MKKKNYIYRTNELIKLFCSNCILITKPQRTQFLKCGMQINRKLERKIITVISKTWLQLLLDINNPTIKLIQLNLLYNSTDKSVNILLKERVSTES